ncbi:MAG: hypothetical protein OEM84_03535 [Acidimicrobiia bacterium]|nr:hypothetical protein [Acidimicrobiia bacterium]
MSAAHERRLDRIENHVGPPSPISGAQIDVWIDLLERQLDSFDRNDMEAVGRLESEYREAGGLGAQDLEEMIAQLEERAHADT